MRIWKISIHFDDGTTHLLSVTLSDIAAFIKEDTNKNGGVKIYSTLPIDSWLVEIVFNKAKRDCPTANLIDATIFQRS